jgi:hypothetical protein
LCSITIRTARSRTSGEYLLDRPMTLILPRNHASDQPRDGSVAAAVARYAQAAEELAAAAEAGLAAFRARRQARR